MSSTPIILIAYNRPEHTAKVLESLRHHNVQNLYVFSDAPKSSQHDAAVGQVRRLIHDIDWCKPVVVERTENFGLARSIVSAVDMVFEQHDRLILLEDDCVPGPHFFDFMFKCLDKYESNANVYGISGHTVPLNDEIVQDYPYDAYFSPRIGSWGWATWKRAWKFYDRDIQRLVKTALTRNIDWNQGGNDWPVMLSKFLRGEIKDVWTMNWVLSVYNNNGCYVFPTRTHVTNIGTDGTGVHCAKSAAYLSKICEHEPTRFPDEIFFDRGIIREFYRRFDSKPRRGISLPLRPDGSDTLRVAQINTTDVSGGAAKVAWTIKEGLKERGVFSNMFVGRKTSDAIEVTEIRDAVADSEEDGEKTGLLYYKIRSTFKLAQNSRFASSDILHFHNLHGNYFNLFALPGLTRLKPSVWTLHDMQSLTGHCAHSFDCERWKTGCGSCGALDIEPSVLSDRTAAVWADKKKIYDDSDMTIVVPSQWLRNKVEQGLLQDKRIELIYNGIDTRVFRPSQRQQARAELNLPNDGTILAFTANGGMNSPWRDGKCLAIAAQYFSQKYQNVYFLNIGNQSNAFNAPNIINVPYVSDESKLARLYSAADLFLFPSLADNCPLVVLEAMSCGLPVVTYRTGGIPEIVQDGVTGIITPYKDIHSFIHNIAAMIDNAEKRRELGHACIETARKTYAMEKMVDKHLRLYHELIEGRKRSKDAAVPDRVSMYIPCETGTSATSDKTEPGCLVSAIVSTYNSERFIRGCLENLESQTIADKMEIIVVDSGSQENEAAIVKEFQQRYNNIKYIRTERETIYGAWNRAIKVASGKYIANANTDDRYYADALERLATGLERNPNKVVGYGNQHMVSTLDGEVTGEILSKQYSHSQLLGGVCIHSQPMWRRDIHEVIGYFDDQFFVSGDYEFWIRVTQQFDALHLDYFTGKRLVNESVISQSQKSLLQLENSIISQSYEYTEQMGSRIGKEGISRDSRFAEWPEIKVWKRRVAAKLASQQWKPSDEVAAVKDTRTAGTMKLSVIVIETDATQWQCIQSLAKQSDQNFELILIAYRTLLNPSDMGTFAGRSCIIQLKDNIGVAFARNIGIAHAQGEFVAYLDPSMRAEYGWTEAIFRQFANPQVKAVRGQIVGNGDPEQAGTAESYATFCESIDNCAFRKATLLEAEGFNEDLFALEGYELSYRIYKGASNALDAIRFESRMLVRFDAGLTESQRISRDIRNTRMSRLLWGKYNDIEGFLEFYRIQNPATRWQYDSDYDKIVATAIFLEKDHPDLAIDYARKAFAIEPDEHVKGSYLLGSLLLKYGEYEQATDVLESAVCKFASVIAADPGPQASARLQESYENDMKCYVSTCTKLAQCYMKFSQFGKVKTIYQSLLGHKALPIEPQQLAVFEAVLAKLRSVQATPITPESHRQAQARLGQVQSSHISTLPAISDEHAGSKYLISAIVSTYNSESFIRGCMEDLERQTIADKLEIIVIDSGSEQNEEAIVRDFQKKYDNIRYVRTQREGLYAAWNRAIRLAKGKYLTSANTDDRHRADCLERLSMALEADPEAAMAYADQAKSYIENETFESTSATLTYSYPEFHPDVFLEIGHHHTGSQPMWRASLHHEIGLFDEKFKVAGDYDFLLRICEHFRCIHVPEVLGTFHHSPSTISGSRLDLLNRIENPIARARSVYRKAAKAMIQNDRATAINLLQRSINDWPSREALLQMRSRSQSAQPDQYSCDIDHIRSINDWPDTEAILNPDRSTPDDLASLITLKSQAYRHLYNSPGHAAPPAPIARENNLLRLMQGGDANVVRKVRDLRTAGHQARLSIIIVGTGNFTEMARMSAALASQTCSDFEVVIVSADSPIEEHVQGSSVPALGVCYIELNADYGPAMARNAGVAHAVSELVAFLDPEMQPHADYVRNLVAHFDDISLAGLRGRVMSHDGVNKSGNFDCGDQTCIAIADVEGLCAFRKSIFLELGGFDKQLCLHHGPELSCRMVRHCNSNPASIRYFPDVVAFKDLCPTPAQALTTAIEMPLYMALAECINPQLAQYHEFVVGSYPQNQARYHTGFRQLLGRAAFLENWDLPQALTMAKEAILQQPDSFRAKYILGSIYAKLGDFKNASDNLEQVIDPLIQVIANTAQASAPEELTDHQANVECLVSVATKLAQCYMKMGTLGKLKAMCRLVAQSGFVPDSTKHHLNRITEKLRDVSPEQTVHAGMPESSTSVSPAAPTVSVIMPVYNCREYIAQGIESVLAQSYSGFELVIVDDGSTDGTVDIIRSFTDPRIKYFRKDNGGASKARNEGIRRAAGRYVILLDADDVITQDYISEHMRVFQANPAAALVYCDQILIDEENRPLRELKQFEYADRASLVRDMFRCGYPVIQPRGMLRRDVFTTIGLLDESLIVGEDYELMCRFVKAGLIAAHLPLPLYKRRMRTGSLTHDDDPAKADSHFAAVDRLIHCFSHSELFPDVNWSAVPSDKIAATAKCLIGTTFLAMTKNYRAANKPCSAVQALDRATSNLRESAKLDRTNTKSRQLLRNCEILHRQILLSPTDEGSSETSQDSRSRDDNSEESLNSSSDIMGT